MGFDKQDHDCFNDSANVDSMNVEMIEDNNLEDMDRITGENSSNIVEVTEEEYLQLLMNMKTAKRGSQEFNPNTDSCANHLDLFLHEDEKLVKPGDKFSTHEEFLQYLNENAKRWFYYYSCYDSKKPNTENESYTYICIYHINKEKYKKKGVRKRNNTVKSDCPCKIKIRRLPNEEELTVVYACNHHDHELSLEQFCKLQHGRRLPPYIKEEIMDFLALGVDKGKIRKYVEIETGFEMSSSYFYTLKKNLKMYNNAERHISDERLKMLNDKLAVVDEIYSGNQSSHGEVDDYEEEDMETPHRNKPVNPRQVLKSMDAKNVQIKRKPSTSSSESPVPMSSKKIKLEKEADVKFREILQSVKNLHESIKCETQTNPWVSDQCVPVLPNRKCKINTEKNNDSQESSKSQHDPENEIVSYRIEYYNPEDNTQIVMNEFGEIINDDNQPSHHPTNDIENIAYETVVTDSETQNVMEEYVTDNGETQHVMEEYIDYEIANDDIMCDTSQERVNDNDYTNKIAVYSGSSKKVSVNGQNSDSVTIYKSESAQNVNEYALADHVILCENDSQEAVTDNAIPDDTVAIYNGNAQENIDDISHVLVDNAEGVIEGDHVEYLHEDSGHLVHYVNDNSEESPGHDVGVQTSTNADTGQMLLPVFDVYMKDGNVTGFVLNNNVINGLKDGVDKGIQTSEDIIYSDIQDIENEDSEIILNSSDKTGDTITKHEYVHKYNIDQYMMQPQFPKYVQILAKETCADVLNMFTNVYNEKAMFKLTTTQKGNEGNTRIRYITHNGKINKKNRDDATKEKLGRNLQSIFILKEKMRMIKKQNTALVKRNKYLEDIVLKVVNLQR